MNQRDSFVQEEEEIFERGAAAWPDGNLVDDDDEEYVYIDGYNFLSSNKVVPLSRIKEQTRCCNPSP